MADWLEDQNPFEEFDKAKQSKVAIKKENDQEALLFANKFRVFESGAAKDVLDFLTQRARRMIIPPKSTETEFAFYEGQRELIEWIHGQMDFAKNGGQSPYRER